MMSSANDEKQTPFETLIIKLDKENSKDVHVLLDVGFWKFSGRLVGLERTKRPFHYRGNAGTRPLPLIFNKPLDNGIQRLRVNWLDHVLKKAGCLALAHVDFRTEAAHSDSA